MTASKFSVFFCHFRRRPSELCYTVWAKPGFNGIFEIEFHKVSKPQSLSGQLQTEGSVEFNFRVIIKSPFDRGTFCGLEFDRELCTLLVPLLVTLKIDFSHQKASCPVPHGGGKRTIGSLKSRIRR